MGAKWRLAAVATVMFALTACGNDGGDGNGVASLNGDQQTSGQPQPQKAGTDEDQMRAYAKCMREHGVDMKDPEPGGGITMRAMAPEEAGKMDKAGEACNKLLPNGGKPKPLSPEELDKMRKTAKCMRDHGIDIPDPDPNNPGITIGIPNNDPGKMDKAMKECGMGGIGAAAPVAPGGGK
ncbi:hypothetical protein JOF56_001538 [Kibdelosporangium banguiense]|uniref:Secreted protein n=1 Tax=Kibdelosporangium banguiense TaxID=1365924 RepID=A0ABS4T9Q1_9PSEU|nr:hypothetical protein [Kibdelosporangium banguiense]MBP2321153.1 hypothetical protein [Kibdelosporangium banguiense]